MSTSTNNKKETKEFNELDLYKQILQRIKDSRDPKCERMSEHLKSLEIPGSTYNLIQRFVDGRALYPDRKKPMKDEKRNELMSKLGMELQRVVYIVECDD